VLLVARLSVSWKQTMICCMTAFPKCDNFFVGWVPWNLKAVHIIFTSFCGTTCKLGIGTMILKGTSTRRDNKCKSFFLLLSVSDNCELIVLLLVECIIQFTRSVCSDVDFQCTITSSSSKVFLLMIPSGCGLRIRAHVLILVECQQWLAVILFGLELFLAFADRSGFSHFSGSLGVVKKWPGLFPGK